MKHLLRRSLALAGTMAILATPLASQAQTITNDFSAGDLIKASGSTVYYFASNGKRFVFPNDKTYFTWYANFDGVKRISDGALSQIPLGGNVTYRPGVKMIKITTDPKVYAVDQNGVLRWVKTQQIAESLYGLAWKNRIDDVPDAFFVNYRVGNPIELSAEFKPADIMTLTQTISQDKQMDETIATISIGNVDNGFVPKSVTLKRGTTVTWTNRDNAVHNVTGAGWTSGDIAPNGEYKRKFDTNGSFEYRDTIHPSNTATINVVN